MIAEQSTRNVLSILKKMFLCRYVEAVPLLETIFCVREKLLTIANVHVVLVLCELVSTVIPSYRTVSVLSYPNFKSNLFKVGPYVNFDN